MADAPDLKDADRYEWERIVRRCALPSTTKAVAAYLAQYANRDGTRIYPGVARLAVVTGFSERAVRGALTQLRELDLITRTRKGSSLGRQALTDEHKLTFPVDLMRRIHMLDPDESPASAACVLACQHPRSPARAAADKRAAAEEHRQLTTGSPATDAGTPATDDRITGSRCTPPTHDHPSTHSEDQREEQLGNLSTEDDEKLLAYLRSVDELAARRAAR